MGAIRKMLRSELKVADLYAETELPDPGTLGEVMKSMHDYGYALGRVDPPDGMWVRCVREAYREMGAMPFPAIMGLRKVAFWHGYSGALIGRGERIDVAHARQVQLQNDLVIELLRLPDEHRKALWLYSRFGPTNPDGSSTWFMVFFGAMNVARVIQAFRTLGFAVLLPTVEVDAQYGVDLIAVDGDRRFGVQVKSRRGIGLAVAMHEGEAYMAGLPESSWKVFQGVAELNAQSNIGLKPVLVFLSNVGRQAHELFGYDDLVGALARNLGVTVR